MNPTLPEWSVTDEWRRHVSRLYSNQRLAIERYTRWLSYSNHPEDVRYWVHNLNRAYSDLIAFASVHP